VTHQQMERLWSFVRDAQAEKTRPWQPGETSRPVTFVTDHLAKEGWKLGWLLVAAYREQHPALFRSYSETDLHVQSLDLLSEAEQPPTLDDLVRALAAKAAEDEGTWLIDVPLANIKMDRRWAPAGSTALVRQAWNNNWKPGEQRSLVAENDADDEFAIFQHLKDRPSPITRFYMLGDAIDDTKRTASLTLIQDGRRQIAVEQATAKAHYALATWWILSPGDWQERPPIVGTWAPQPDQWEEPPHKRYDPDQWISKERRHNGAIYMYEPYALPADDILAAPFAAFQKITLRPAQALLGSTAALYRCEVGSDLTLSERISEVARAIERLCEPANGGQVWKRWSRLSAHFKVWSTLGANRGYSPSRAKELQQRLRNARNISTHGADAALIDLGWTAGNRHLMHGHTALADDLALAALYRDLRPMVAVVGEALQATWHAMLDSNFSEEAFERLFA